MKARFALAVVAALLIGSALAYDASPSPDPYAQDSYADDKAKLDKLKEAVDDVKDKVKAAADDMKDKMDASKKAFEIFKLKSCSGNDANYNAMQCTGHAYCFVKKVDKNDVEPECAEPGFTYDEKMKKCFKVTGYTCSDKENVKMGADGKSCLVCKKDEFVNAAGKCQKACKKGYAAVKVNGKDFCVEECSKDETPMGNECVNFGKLKSFKPKECSAKKCLPGQSLYFTKGDKPVAGSYGTDAKGSAAKVADKSYGKDTYADSYSKDPSECVCAKSKERDIYEQDPCEDPKVEKADPKVETCDAVCTDGDKKKPFMGKCGKCCPAATTETKDGKCLHMCPKGFKMCKPKLGKAFCATENPLFGCDSCEVLEKMYKNLDKEYMCSTIKKAQYDAKVASYKPKPKA